MIKKITAYSFIFVANFILLAHAVIPHHHHQSIICFEKTENHHESHDCDFNFSAEEHHHHGNTSSTACVLKVLVLDPISHNKLIKNYTNLLHTQYYNFCLISNFEYTEVQSDSKSLNPHTGFIPLITSCLTNSIGLRAPPEV